ncbi:hemerythrin domain-containing protein [Brevibacterium zhoupengii]|uniref:hemerythrin domain-containing protein n=1 Tax=Brevibacterium zhoupengii TaxID=2898795 RepID=UPI001E409063|nr:hemerythrin domain-containing protein [Brevibacterium zhoupengii]
MNSPLLSTLLEREHEEIDGGIEEYADGLTRDESDSAPLLRAMAALRRHIYLEEEFIFPTLRTAGLMMPVFVMLREHGEIWDAMASLDEQLAADADAQAMDEACRDLLTRLEAHNSKEEPIIYPRADAELSDDATNRLRGFLDAGAMPKGWQCEKATL